MHLIDVTNNYSDLVQSQLNTTDANYVKVYSLGNTSVNQESALSLFRSTLADEIAAMDVMTLTPLEALNLLHKFNLQAKQEAGKL